MDKHVKLIEEMRNAYKVLLRKPEGRRSFGRFRYKCEGNINMKLNETTA
jgi:hypothetical protein